MSYFPEVVDLKMRSAFVQCATSFKYAFIDNISRLSTHDVAEDELDFQRRLADHRQASFSCGYQRPVVVELAQYLEHWPMGSDGIHPYVDGKKSMIGQTVLFDLNVTHPMTMKPLKLAIHIPMLGVDQETGGLVVLSDRLAAKPTTAFDADMDEEVTAQIWAARTLSRRDDVTGEIRTVTWNMSGPSEQMVLRPKWMLDRWFSQVTLDFQRMASTYRHGRWDMRLDGQCSGCDYRQFCLQRAPVSALPAGYARVQWLPKTQERRSMS